LETRGVGHITRTLLHECLKQAEERSHGNLGRRLEVASRTDAWGLMDENWQGLLFTLLKHAAENDSKSPGKGRRKPGRRGGRGDRMMMKHFEMDSVNTLLASEGDEDYRLTVLLTHKALMGDDWDNNWNSNMNQMRSACEKNGVHPVFHLFSSTFQSILGELGVYDIVEEIIEDDPAWLKSCRIDPTDSELLTELVKPPIGIHLQATHLSSLKRLHGLMARKGAVKAPWLSRHLDAKLLDEKNGSTGLLAAILATAAANGDIEKRFTTLANESGIIGEIAAAQLLLIHIRNDDEDVWTECLSLSQGESLNDACRAEAWARTPQGGGDLSLKELQTGLIELEEWSEIRQVEVSFSPIKWAIVEKMANSGDGDGACLHFPSLSINNDLQLTIALSLLNSSCHDIVVNKIEKIVSKDSGLDLSLLLSHDSVPVSIRLSVSELLEIGGKTDQQTEEMMLELYTSTGDIEALASLLATHDDAAKTNPHLTLVAARLIGAGTNSSLLEWAREERKNAFLLVNDIDLPEYLSPAAFALTSLLDGGIADIEQISSLLDADGLQSFKQCRRAMMEDGDGLVPQQLLEKMEESISSADIGMIESMLFRQLILNLKLNRADSLLQRAEKESHAMAEEIIENVLTNTPPTYRLMKNVNAQVLEHGVASEALEKWYKSNNAQSMEACIATGRYAEKRNNRLQAARAYQTAATRCDNFELRQKLNKEALISFAHSGNWPEAIELLESEAGLKANITERFALYLQINDEAARGGLEVARNMILNSVAESKMIQRKNDEGNTYEAEQITYSSESLNLHLTYPSIHRLPEEPFRGRVLAAINKSQKGRRRGQDVEQVFQKALERREFTEIFTVANRATEERGAEHGLLFYERAIDSGKFDVAGLKRLSDMQRGMYTRTEQAIPVRKRIHLKNLALKPLVVVDTNLLVDALAERVLRLLEIERDVPMHLDSRREFHKTLLFRKQQGRIEMYIPAATRNELRTIAATPGRVRGICGDRLIDPKLWDKKVNEKVLIKLTNDVIDEYNSWNPPKDEGVNELVQSRKPEFEIFFAGLRNVYSDITDAKLERGHAQSKRFEIKGEALYPEAGDIDIMLFSAHLAEQSLEGFGSILVASRDSDFTIPARALQERFGFVTVDNAQALARYTH
jgi:hypothetical protein